MVEFPLVARRSARGLRRRLRNLSQIPPFADINFVSPNRRLTQADMWETNTLAASYHARLNVAPQHEFGPGRIPGCAGKHPSARELALIRGNRAGSLLQFVINSATPWPASGSGPAASRQAPVPP